MSATAVTAVPFERQSDPQTRRDCGAACLSMVYGSFGRNVPPIEIWPAISKPNHFGAVSSTTHLMAQDALNRGFCAVAIQARHPLQALRVCRDSAIRAILNLRPTDDSPAGHYAVLVEVEDHHVVLHDPFYGPSRQVPGAELLDLWQPRLPNSEIAGNVLIGIAAQPTSITSCWLCHAPTPSHVGCPNCKMPVGLQPGALLGCTNNDCIVRMWNTIYCPSCDFPFTFSLQAPPAGATASSLPNGLGHPDFPSPLPPEAQAAPASADDPFNLNRAFAELDKFCSRILSFPAAANHPEIKKQLDLITTCKVKLKLAQTEELVHRKARQAQLANMLKTAKQNEEAHRKKMEELNKPSPPLDGDALGRALLKNLGFTE